MNLNATLLVQVAVLIILGWITMKFIWPPLIRAMEDRQKKIAAGLAAAERGQKELEESHGAAATIVSEARDKAAKIIEQANRRSGEIVDEARSTAITEGQRLVGDARQEVALEQARARDALRKDVATLAVAGASRLLEREIDPRAHADLIESSRARSRRRRPDPSRMAERATIARPYAKAAFAYARENGRVAEWARWLATARQVVSSDDYARLAQSPGVRDVTVARADCRASAAPISMPMAARFSRC